MGRLGWLLMPLLWTLDPYSDWTSRLPSFTACFILLRAHCLSRFHLTELILIQFLKFSTSTFNEYYDNAAC